MDLLGAAIGVVNIGVAGTVEEGDKLTWYGVEMAPGTGIALGLTQLALYGASAAWGLTQTSRCRELRREIAEQDPKWTPEEPAD